MADRDTAESILRDLLAKPYYRLWLPIDIADRARALLSRASAPTTEVQWGIRRRDNGFVVEVPDEDTARWWLYRDEQHVQLMRRLVGPWEVTE